MKAAKVIHPSFNLSTVMGRTVFLTGVAMGTVPTAYIQAVVNEDNQRRPYRKPVVAYGKRYPSVTEAAIANSSFVGRKAVNAMQKNIARWCNEDCHEGFYWSE